LIRSTWHQAGRAKLILLDQTLSEYGPEAIGARTMLCQTLISIMDIIWPTGNNQGMNIKPGKYHGHEGGAEQYPFVETTE